jgi:hypothetical protein
MSVTALLLTENSFRVRVRVPNSANFVDPPPPTVVCIQKEKRVGSFKSFEEEIGQFIKLVNGTTEVASHLAHIYDQISPESAIMLGICSNSKTLYEHLFIYFPSIL